MFNPGHMTVALSTSVDGHGWDLSCTALPTALRHKASAHHRHASSGDTTFHSLRKLAADSATADCTPAVQYAHMQTEVGEHLPDRISFSSADTTFECGSSDRELLCGDNRCGGCHEAGVGSSRCSSPMAVTSLLSPCPLLHGQSTSAIAQVSTGSNFGICSESCCLW